MSNVKWLIEDTSLPEDTRPLLDALSKQKIEYELIDSSDYFQVEDNFLSIFPPDNCVVFMGSLGMAKRIRKKAKWIPGVYYNVEAYNCVSYYAKLGKYLFNENYVMLPWGELKRRKEFLYDCLGQDRAIFLRPNRGDKIFTGQLIFKEDFDEKIDRLNITNFSDSELVVAAQPRNIEREWRAIIVKGNVVAGSQYKERNIVQSHPSFPIEAANLAEEVARIYQPDVCFVVDVCQTVNDEFKVMEVGCFSCAGLYHCDRNAIVEAVSKAAIEEWESY